MFATVPVPQKGDRITAAWGAAVANGVNALAPFAAAHGLVRQGVGNGTEPLPENRRNRTTSTAEEHPWKVYALAQSEDVDHCFEIYIPDGVVHVGETEIDVEGVTAVTGSTDRYTVDCESEIEDDGEFILAVYREDDGESSAASSDDETSAWTAKIVSSAESVEDAAEVLALLPIAAVGVNDDGDYPVGEVSLQYLRSAIALANPGHEPDGISTDTVTDEEAEDPNAIQIKDFDNDESDGQHGLAQRLKVVKDGEGEDASYRIEGEDSDATVHVVARVNGKIKYIPLTGSDEQDDDEKDADKGCDDHPSGGDAVDPNAEKAVDDDGWGGGVPAGYDAGGATGGGGRGGVPSGGDGEGGVKDCDC